MRSAVLCSALRLIFSVLTIEIMVRGALLSILAVRLCWCHVSLPGLLASISSDRVVYDTVQKHS